jgi:hypothetical protein
MPRQGEQFGTPSLDIEKMATSSVVPGTVHLVDLQGTLHVKHARGKALADVVLVPAPSNDPDDPLNWSPGRKLMSTISLTVYLLMIGLAVSCVYSIIVPISQATGLTVNGTILYTSEVSRRC